MNGERGRFSEETCPVCHKTFVVPDAGIWAYKLRRYKKRRMVIGLHIPVQLEMLSLF